MAKRHTSESEQNPNQLRNRLITTGLVAGAGAAALTGCGPEGTAPTTPEVPEKPESVVEQVEAAIAARPEPGTPEYQTEVIDRFVIPYVEGQAAGEVAQEVFSTLNELRNAAYLDAAPQERRDVAQWQVDTGKSANDLVALIDTSYYTTGAALAWFGEDWQNNGYASTFLIPNLTENANGASTNWLLDAGEPIESVTIDPSVVLSASENEIRLEGASTNSTTGEKVDEFTQHLVATDVDGDGDFDVWRFNGPAR